MNRSSDEEPYVSFNATSQESRRRAMRGLSAVAAVVAVIAVAFATRSGRITSSKTNDSGAPAINATTVAEKVMSPSSVFRSTTLPSNRNQPIGDAFAGPTTTSGPEWHGVDTPGAAPFEPSQDVIEADALDLSRSKPVAVTDFGSDRVVTGSRTELSMAPDRRLYLANVHRSIANTSDITVTIDWLDTSTGSYERATVPPADELSIIGPNQMLYRIGVTDIRAVIGAGPRVGEVVAVAQRQGNEPCLVAATGIWCGNVIAMEWVNPAGQSLNVNFEQRDFLWRSNDGQAVLNGDVVEFQSGARVRVKNLKAALKPFEGSAIEITAVYELGDRHCVQIVSAEELADRSVIACVYNGGVAGVTVVERGIQNLPGGAVEHLAYDFAWVVKNTPSGAQLVRYSLP
jgi:hypothetical protein